MSLATQLSPAISRQEAIDALRPLLLKRADGHSLCSAAGVDGIFCLGFCRFSNAELRQRLPWLVRKRPEATRADIEELGDRWQLARQEVTGAATACDVQSEEHDLCNGWNDFSDDDLAKFYQELTGETVHVQAG
jgi:hypothetical protein